jgi:Protein of unknown function (DUF2721)
MMIGEILPDVPHAIQLALAPIFLLTGVAGMLNVMASRLSRIIDRGRQLVETPGSTGLSPNDITLELRSLERRRRCANAAITASTVAALLVCIVIALLFLQTFWALPLNGLVGVVFAGSTVGLIFGLGIFLREIHLATRNAHFELRRVETPARDDPMQ